MHTCRQAHTRGYSSLCLQCVHPRLSHKCTQADTPRLDCSVEKVPTHADIHRRGHTALGSVYSEPTVTTHTHTGVLAGRGLLAGHALYTHSHTMSPHAHTFQVGDSLPVCEHPNRSTREWWNRLHWAVFCFQKDRCHPLIDELPTPQITAPRLRCPPTPRPSPITHPKRKCKE